MRTLNCVKSGSLVSHISSVLIAETGVRLDSGLAWESSPMDITGFFTTGTPKLVTVKSERSAT